MKVLEGNYAGKGIKVGIVAARFNEFITSKLVSGALDGLKRHEVEEEDIELAWVPGAFEIPLAAKKMAEEALKEITVSNDTTAEKLEDEIEKAVKDALEEAGIDSKGFCQSLSLQYRIKGCCDNQYRWQRAFL